MKLLPSIVPIALAFAVLVAPVTTTAQESAATVQTNMVATKSPVRVAPKPGPYNAYRGPNYTRRVVLTYDDCPRSREQLRRVAAKAQRLRIGLVLAPTGACIRAGLFDAGYARSRGHYVINHSVTHRDLTKSSTATVRRELGSPGVRTNYGRPPYGAHNSRVDNAYRSVGMRVWLWTVDTNDWRNHKSQREIVRTAVRDSRSGATVLMHMQHNGFNAAAMRSIKSGLSKRGLAVCRPNPKKTGVNLPSSLPC